MARNKRLVIPGSLHHLSQRASEQRSLFRTSADRDLYLRLAVTYAQRLLIEIVAWCLMSNHVHLAMIPRFEESLSRWVHGAHREYARLIHLDIGTTGHLWEGKFFSNPVGDPFDLEVVRYIELNPVRAGMIDTARNYPWSSARYRGSLDADPLVVNDWSKHRNIEDWDAWLAEMPIDRESMNERIRRSLMRGKRLWRPPHETA